MARAGVWITWVALAGCGHPAPAPPLRSDAAQLHPLDDNGRLDQLEQEFLDGLVNASPTTATWLGLHGADDRYDDASLDAQARELARLHRIDVALNALGDLDAQHRFDRSLLQHEVRAAQFDLDEWKPLERNPVRYVQLATAGIDELLSPDFAPLANRFRSIVGRCNNMHVLFDEARRNLKNPPELATRRAIELAQELRSFLADTLPKAVAAMGDDKLVADFRQGQTAALRALDDFVLWMQRDLLPRSHGDFALGENRLHKRLLLDGVDLDAKGLVSLAEGNLAHVRQRFDAAAKQVAPGKTPADALRTLEEDHPNAEELLAAANSALDQLIAFLREHPFATLPPSRPKVAEMPPFLWGFALVSMPGPFEPQKFDSYLYIDPVDRNWNRKRRDEHLRALNRTQLLLTAAHEAIPGHYVQSETARRAPSTIERLSEDSAFVEGWAAYAEEWLSDAGFGDARFRLAQAREALVRACRFLAAVRLHTGAAKIDEATKLFADEAQLDDYSARREAERAALDPWVLAPAFGRLQLEDLRDHAREVRGSDFRLADFHDQLLGHGAPPIALLRPLLFSDEK